MIEFVRQYLHCQVRRFVKNETAVTAIEYSLIAALIGVAIITAVSLVGTKLNTAFGSVSAKLGGAS